MTFAYYFKSDIGTTRDSNQDCVYADTVKTPLGVMFLGVVCDGMGGFSKGEFASRTVVDTFRNWFENGLTVCADPSDFSNVILKQWTELIERSNNALREMAQNFGEKMGTTLSALLIANGEYYAAQVGDSRIYHCSGDLLKQVTTDHSYVMEQVRKGMMTESEARLSRRRNVLTRCIGVEKSVIGDFFHGGVISGDSFLISSDGFHGGVPEDKIREILIGLNARKRREAEQRIKKFIETRKKSGEKDNITALVVLAK